MSDARILIVDDEPVNVRLLERVLATAGYRSVEGITDPREALARYRALQPDLVLLDLMMPHLDGIAVLGQLKAEMGEDYRPVLVLTADVTLDARRRALEAGATDFLTKPFEQVEVLLRIGNMLETRRLYGALEAHNRSLEQMVRERTERLLQSEKIATMGSLLAGVAHELNNPLAVLSGHVQLLRETAGDPEIAVRTDKILDAADRCVRIVRNFLALARQRPPERGRVHVKEVARGAVELLGYQLRTAGIDVTMGIPDGLPAVWADRHQLHQVLVNLVGNAQQAMRHHAGRRAVEIAARHDAARGRVRLEVADTGPGMPPEVRARIFEPFFTTKPVGEGTGLGLSLCRSMIEEHGGTIDVASEPGQGARFLIELPVATERDLAAAEAVGEIPAPVGRKAVLVVDDEEEVASVLAETLTRDGHTAQIAPNGAVALELLRVRRFDLIISDTKMPVLDGETFYEDLMRDFPDMRARIVFLTGDVLSREKREFLERTGAPFLAKPFELGDIRAVVRRVLAG
jgi:two-component system NtrC family sensor kinase